MKLYELIGYIKNVRGRKRTEAGCGYDDPKKRWMDVMAKPQINVSSPHHASNLLAPNPMKPAERYVR